MKVWAFKVNDREVRVHGGSKENASNLARALSRALNLGKYARQIMGPMEEPEKQKTYETMALVTDGGTADPEGYADAVQKLLAALPEDLDAAQVTDFQTWAVGIVEKFMRTEDLRTTAEQREQKAREIAERQRKDEEARKQAEAPIRERYTTGEEVEVPAGDTAIVLQMTYDNSDSMSDYFDRHRPYGPRILLGIAPAKARQTEGLARRMVALYADLRPVLFRWKTEQWSGGHGNYLVEDHPATGPEITDANGRTLNLTHEIQFERHYGDGEPKKYLAFKGYPGEVVLQPQGGDVLGSNKEAMVVHNLNQNGVEIHWAKKPAPEVLEKLRAKKWRWAMKSKCWYKRKAGGVVEEAFEIAGLEPQTVEA